MKEIEGAITDRTRAIFAETIGNPKLDVTDVPQLAELAHQHGLPLIIDNTVATAMLMRPISLGADIVINSTSKYINGNSSAISGVITDSGHFKWDACRYPGMKPYAKFGSFAYTAKLRNGLFRNTGACMAPQTAFYNLDRHGNAGTSDGACMRQRAGAGKIPGFASRCGRSTYPGLASSPWYDTATQLLKRALRSDPDNSSRK